MVPTKITRSVARKNGATFHSLDAGVHKTFQCIICNKGHGSKAALSRHFKSHNTRPEELSPFVHPSCWDEKPLTSYRPSKEEIGELTVESNVFDALPSDKQRAIDAKITYALAREHKLQDQGQAFYINGITAEDNSLLELANTPPISQLEPLSAANAPTTHVDHLASNPDQAAYTDSAQTGFYDHDFDRSLRGSVIADFELASTRPLTSLPLLWCMSNTFTHSVKAHGEDVVCAVSLKRAVETYLDNIGTSHDLVDKLNSRFDYRIMSKYENLDQCDEEDKWAARLSNEKRFRKDRAFIWDVLEEAINDYFNDYGNCELPVARGARQSSDAVKVVVKATRTFVTVLDDAQTSAYLKKYWNGRI